MVSIPSIHGHQTAGHLNSLLRAASVNPEQILFLGAAERIHRNNVLRLDVVVKDNEPIHVASFAI
jgi:hypothetical protein